MPRPPKIDPLRATIQSLGQQIGSQLAEAITTSFNSAINVPTLKGGAAPKGRPGRPPSVSGKGCSVPGCSRAHAAKGLCQNHYAKAIRLKLDASKLSAGDLETLGQDGRALRWKK